MRSMKFTTALFLSYSCSAHLELMRVGVTSADVELLPSVTPRDMRMKIKSHSCCSPPREDMRRPRQASAQGIFCHSITASCGDCGAFAERLVQGGLPRDSSCHSSEEGTRDLDEP